jgi:hypothetical protein
MKYRNKDDESIYARHQPNLRLGHEDIRSDMTFVFEVIEKFRYMSTGALQQDAFEAAWRIKRLYKATKSMSFEDRAVLQESVDAVRVDGIRCL